MNVIGITSQSSFFSCGDVAQGIMGLAYSDLSVSSNLPVTMDVLAAAGVPDGFGLQLCSGLPGATSSRTGNMWIGGYDSSFTTAPMQWIKITNKLYYGVQVNGFSLNGAAISGMGNLNADGGAIIDSGTTLIILNSQASYNALVAGLKASGVVTFSSQVSNSEINQFWNSERSIPSGSYTLHAGVAITVDFLGTSGETVHVPLPHNNIFPVQDGKISFQGITAQEGFNTIIGETLFTGSVVFFDRGAGSRVGFAPAHNCFSTTSAAGIDVFATGSHTTTTTTGAHTTRATSAPFVQSAAASSSSSSDPNTVSPVSFGGTVAASVVGALCGVAIIGGVAAFYVARRRRQPDLGSA